MNTTNLETFIRRLDKIGIKIEMVGNYPWIYLDKVNGVKIKTRFKSEHGYHMYWYPLKPKTEGVFVDLPHLFNTIRNVLNFKKEASNLTKG